MSETTLAETLLQILELCGEEQWRKYNGRGFLDIYNTALENEEYGEADICATTNLLVYAGAFKGTEEL